MIYFRCRICGRVALVSGDDERVVRCTACGFTESAGAAREGGSASS